jgi:hypothetical protein
VEICLSLSLSLCYNKNIKINMNNNNKKELKKIKIKGTAKIIKMGFHGMLWESHVIPNEYSNLGDYEVSLELEEGLKIRGQTQTFKKVNLFDNNARYLGDKVRVGENEFTVYYESENCEVINGEFNIKVRGINEKSRKGSSSSSHSATAASTSENNSDSL